MTIPRVFVKDTGDDCFFVLGQADRLFSFTTIKKLEQDEPCAALHGVWLPEYQCGNPGHI